VSHLCCDKTKRDHLLVFKTIDGDRCAQRCFSDGNDQFSLTPCFKTVIIIF
jgi:hypothetical protein